MKANTLLAASLVALISLSSTAQCAIIMFFDPADLSVLSTGADQSVDLGILVQHDGTGLDTISGFTLDHSESSPSLDIVPGSGFASDFTWATASGVNASSISGSNFANHTIDTSGTQLLGTLQYTLDQSFTSGSIPIDLTFNNAQRDGFNSIPASEVSVSGGTLMVSAAAVPEPSSSLVLLGMTACCAAVALRRRRRKHAKHSQSQIA